MGKLDVFAAGFVSASIVCAVLFSTVQYFSGSRAEREVDRQAYGWKRYTEGVTEGARQATLKCPYNYRMKP